MKFYLTNAGLGYQEHVCLLHIKDDNYLCIDKFNVAQDDMYIIGEMVKNLESVYVTKTEYDIKDSPLYNEHLFNYLLKNN